MVLSDYQWQRSVTINNAATLFIMLSCPDSEDSSKSIMPWCVCKCLIKTSFLNHHEIFHSMASFYNEGVKVIICYVSAKWVT